MPERVYVFTARIIVPARDEETARFKLGNATSGVTLRILDVTEGQERTFQDDIDEAGPLTEREMFEGAGVPYDLDVDAVARRRRVPHALKRDLGIGGAG